MAPFRLPNRHYTWTKELKWRQHRLSCLCLQAFSCLYIAFLRKMSGIGQYLRETLCFMRFHRRAGCCCFCLQRLRYIFRHAGLQGQNKNYRKKKKTVKNCWQKRTQVVYYTSTRKRAGNKGWKEKKIWKNRKKLLTTLTFRDIISKLSPSESKAKDVPWKLNNVRKSLSKISTRKGFKCWETLKTKISIESR